LYARFGFRAPFVFGEICTLIDLVLRSLIIERDVAISWGYDPAIRQDVNVASDLEASSPPHHPSDALSLAPAHPLPEHSPALADPKQNPSTPDSRPPSNNLIMSDVSLARKSLPMLSVMRLLGQSPRAVAALIMSLVYGYVVVTSRRPC